MKINLIDWSANWAKSCGEKFYSEVPDYEFELLSGMLWFKPVYEYCSKRIDKLKFNVFSDIRLQTIYNISRKIVTDGHIPDIVLMAKYAKKLNLLEKAGGMAFLSCIYCGIDTSMTPNYKPLLDYLIELAYKRNIKL